MTIDGHTWTNEGAAAQPYPGQHRPQVPGSEPVEPRRWSRKATVLTVTAATAVIGGAGTAIALTSGVERPLVVNYTLFDEDASCSGGSGGYSDIGPGNPVTVRNGAGEILAASSLSDGDGVIGAYCTWTVVLPDVAADEDFYSIEIGRRGEISFSRAELAQSDWVAELSIGM